MVGRGGVRRAHPHDEPMNPKTLALIATLMLTGFGCKDAVRALVEPTEEERREFADKKKAMVLENTMSDASREVTSAALVGAAVGFMTPHCAETAAVMENRQWVVRASGCGDAITSNRGALEGAKICKVGRDDAYWCKVGELARAPGLLERHALMAGVCEGGTWTSTFGRGGADMRSTLTLVGCAVDAEGLAPLLAHPDLSTVRDVRLDGVKLTPDAWEALLTAAPLGEAGPLEHVRLSNLELDDAAREVLGAHLWTSRAYTFSRAGVDAALLPRLAHEHLTTLRLFDEEGADDAFMKSLERSLPAPERLGALVVAGGTYGEAGLKVLGALVNRSAVVSLSLARSSASDAALGRFLSGIDARADDVKLHVVDLAGTKADARTARALVAMNTRGATARVSLCLEDSAMAPSSANALVDGLSAAKSEATVFLGSKAGRGARRTEHEGAVTVYYQEMRCVASPLR